MYWWNIKALANELKAKKVSQLEKFKYFFALTIVVVVIGELSYLFPLIEKPNSLDILDSLAYIAVTAFGILACYKANKRGDNKEFIDRFICLSWPIGILLFVIFMISAVFYLIIGYSIAGDAFFDQPTTLFDVLIFIGIEIAFYLWVRKYILYVSGAVKSKKLS